MAPLVAASGVFTFVISMIMVNGLPGVGALGGFGLFAVILRHPPARVVFCFKVAFAFPCLDPVHKGREPPPDTVRTQMYALRE